MSNSDLKQRSRTNLEALDNKTDGDIDTTDIPPLDDGFFAKAEWQMSARPTVAVAMEPDVLEWFKAQGGDFQRRINAALRIYAEAHKEL